MDKTPIKIIAIIIVPLIIALIVRYTGKDFNSSADEVVNTKGETFKENSEEDSLVKIMTSWPLPENLKEISGISWIDADRFACVQDEKGTVFIYNIKTSTIENEIAFAGKGDYEGVAVAGKTIYVLQANGTIFEIRNYAAKSSVKLYETHLKKKQDSESLTYDRKNNRLLVAIKTVESDNADYKGIYAFDLKSKTMDTKPVYHIDLKNEVFKNEKSKDKAIQPSDIEVHPLTDEIYIIEGTKPKLLILNSNGTVKSLFKLKRSDFSQPEGLSFSPEGLMYIANEGKDNPGNIVQVELLEK